jgi:signal transduction histidine kinase
VEDLLFLTRLDTVEDYYHFRRMDLSALLAESAERAAGLALASGKHIVTELPEGEIILEGDDEKLSRAIFNLLDNGLRYAVSAVTLQYAPRNDGSGRNSGHLIRILDDGPGIDPADQPHLFTRFYKGKKGNLGLGLAIVKSIIEKHGGTVVAANRDNGAGAVFTVFLPDRPALLSPGSSEKACP